MENQLASLKQHFYELEIEVRASNTINNLYGHSTNNDLIDLEQVLMSQQYIFDSNIIGVFYADTETILEANNIFLQMVGYTGADLETRILNWRQMTPAEYSAQDDYTLTELHNKGLINPISKHYIRKDGTRLPVLLGLVLLQQHPFKCVCFVADLSHLRRLEHELDIEFQARNTIHQLSTRYITGNDFGSLLREILEAGIALCHTDKGTLQIHDPLTGNMAIAAQKGFDNTVLELLKTVDTTAPGAAPFHAHQAVIPDLSKSPIFEGSHIPEILQEHGVQAMLSTPLINRNGLLLGIISTYYNRVYYPSKNELCFIKALARQAADIIERKHREDKISHNNIVLEGINQIFHATMSCDSEMELGKACLSVLDTLTQSQFGFINEINSEGRLDDIAISDSGWIACRMPVESGHLSLPKNLSVRGIYGRIILDGKPLFSNDPFSHPDSIGLPDGHPHLTSFLGAPLFYNGNVIGIIGLANRAGGYNDKHVEIVQALGKAIVQVFVRKRAETALRSSEERYRELAHRLRNVDLQQSEERFYKSFHLSPIIKYIINADDSTYLDINAAWLKATGYSREEVIGKTSEDLNIDVDHCSKPGRDSSPSYSIHGIERQFRIKNGDVRTSISSTEHIIIDGAPCILGEVIDITKRIQAERALRDSEEKYRPLFENSIAGIIISDQDGNVIDANPAACRIFGRTREDLYKAGRAGVVDLQDPRVINAINKREKTGSFHTEMTLLRNDGTRFEGEVSSSLYRTSDGSIQCSMMIRDITERKRAEQSIMESEERFFNAFYNNPACMAIVDAETLFYIEVNKMYLYLTEFSKEEILGKTSHELNLWVDVENQHYAIKELKNSGYIDNFETNIRSKSGEILTILGSVHLVYMKGKPCYLVSFTNISELKRLQMEMGRLDRLNIVGQMAASIGHEIRNPMTSVRGFLQMLLGKDDCNQYNEYYELMIDELDRANEIISSFLSMASDKIVDLQLQNLNDTIRSILPLIKSDAIRCDKNVVIELDALPLIYIDNKEIRQLILNLSRNGLEAMSAGGLLTIATSYQDQEVVLYIKDHGPGLDPLIIDKIGTPFLTTKENGTGLGLAVCYSIASRHQARLEVDSGPDGTTFLIRFKVPAADSISPQ